MARSEVARSDEYNARCGISVSLGFQRFSFSMDAGTGTKKELYRQALSAGEERSLRGGATRLDSRWRWGLNVVRINVCKIGASESA